MLQELIGRENVVKYKIDYHVFIKLQKIVLKHLGFSNMNKLRDRFEGQAFYNSFLQRAYAEIALQNELNEEFFTLEEKEKHKNYKPVFKIKGKTTEIVASNLDTYPLIPKGEYDLAAFIFVNINFRETFLIGIVERDDLINNIKNTGLSPILEKGYYGYLKNFDCIKSL